MFSQRSFVCPDFGGHAVRVRYGLAVRWCHLHSDAAQLRLVTFEARDIVRRGSWGGNGIGYMGRDLRSRCRKLGDMD